MTKSPPKSKRFFLATYDPQIDHYVKEAGFYIKMELDGPEIPVGVNRVGKYVILEIVRKFEVEATTTYTPKEVTV